MSKEIGSEYDLYGDDILVARSFNPQIEFFSDLLKTEFYVVQKNACGISEKSNKIAF
jgi:hypothetical protein